MRARLSRFSSQPLRFTALLAMRAFRRGWRRKLVCFALISSLLMWPGPALHQLPVFASALFDTASDTLRNVPAYLRWLFRSKAAVQRPEKLADRIAAVSSVRVSPQRFVGYLGQSLTFTGLPAGIAGSTIQGVRFTWESADPDKVTIDEAGNARFLQPGLAHIICHAGTVSGIATVLVRPGTRQVQTDAEWNDDQNSLTGSMTPGGDKPAIAGIVPGLLEKLAPTVYAQGGGGSSDFPYDELWSEPRNLVGSPRNRAIEPARMGLVLPEGSNFEFAIPIEGLGGRGMGTSLALYYNSRVWSRHGNAVTFNAVNGWPFAGFSLGFGRILTYGSPSNTKYVLIDPNGTRHYLGAGASTTTGTYQTSDGTHITFVGSAAYGGSLYFTNGESVTITVVNNLLLPTQITEPNGNYEQIAYKSSASGFAPLAIDYVTDSLARVIQFQYDANFNLTSITAPGVGGTSQNPVTTTLAQFDYQSRSLGYNFTGLTVENATSGQALNTLRHVYFPVTQTGYLFSYSDYAMIYNTSLRRQMSIDGNGVISDGVECASMNYNYPTAGTTSLSDAPAFTQRTETPGGTFNYSTASGSQTLIFSVARPDSTTLLLTRSTNGAAVDNGLLTQTEIKNSVGTSFAKVVCTYINDPGGSPQVQSVIGFDEVQPTPNQIKVDFDYDSYGNVTNKREYGYQAGGVFQLQRRTQITYTTDPSYINAYLRSLPIEVDVLDAGSNLVAKSTNTYDNYAAYGGMENYGGLANPPGHLSSYNTSVTIRGNVTGTTQYTDIGANTSITRLKKYDIFGNVVTAQVSCCNSKSFTCTETNCWGVPEQETDGSGSTQTTSSNVYDFNTSAVMSQTDPNNVQVSYNYDQFLRPTQMSLPTGATITTTYNDAAMSVSKSVSYYDGLVNKTLTTTQVYDGWLRVLQALDAGGGQVNTSYDAMGRVVSRTNPFPAGGSPGPATGYQYDALGRMTVTTLPDGNTVQNTYSGNVFTITDQVNRKSQRQMDGLGRLVTVNEQDSAGQLTQATSYTYNLLNKLTQVNQGGQFRNYKFDAIGRLLYEQIPEQTATINEAGGTWTCKYIYTDFNAVATKTDARGVVTTYSYDGLNRIARKSYNTASAPAVAATSDVIYGWGGTQLRSVGVCNEFYESYSYDQLNRVVTDDRFIQGRRYSSTYQNNAIGQRTQSTDPGLTLPLSYDNSGRLSAIGSTSTGLYMSGISYNAISQFTGDTLGNGVTENYGYDTQRMQLTTETVTAPGGASGGLMNLTYGYQAAAGQNGTGTTAGNSGQLMSITGTIGGTTEGANYTYDQVGRLVTSSQTTNGVSAQRRFAYDRWGNRTGEWDATSGGNQIQSVALQQSGGAPTNQLLSVTTSGVINNYTYDAAGNVTNDGAHSYQYDAENRLVNVDSGATAQYWYDHQNRRIVKLIAGSKTDCIWNGNQLIEEHDGNASNPGTTQARYVYAGARMLAKMAGGVTRYYLSDRLSTRLILDTSGNVVGHQAHLPFGEDFGESGTQEKHHLTSYERDGESGTDYAVNRQYAQSVGRFQQSDHYRASGYIVDPQSWNRYGYTRNNPANRIDPLGQKDEPYDGGSLGSVTVNAGNDNFSDLGGGIMVEQDPPIPGTVPVEPIPPPPPPKIGTIEDIVKYLQATIDWVLSQGQCRRKIGAYLTAPMHQTLLVDARDPNVRNRERQPDPNHPGETFGDYFARTGGAALTENSWQTGRNGKIINPISYIYFDFRFFDANPEDQAALIIHELLHAILLAGNDTIGQRLGVPHADLNQWILDGCPD
jgi:RHS repeat-associated protein